MRLPLRAKWFRVPMSVRRRGGRVFRILHYMYSRRARAVHFFQVVIVVGVLVLVPHNESDGASGGLALEDAGKEFHLVGFFA